MQDALNKELGATLAQVQAQKDLAALVVNVLNQIKAKIPAKATALQEAYDSAATMGGGRGAGGGGKGKGGGKGGGGGGGRGGRGGGGGGG